MTNSQTKKELIAEIINALEQNLALCRVLRVEWSVSPKEIETALSDEEWTMLVKRLLCKKIIDKIIEEKLLVITEEREPEPDIIRYGAKICVFPINDAPQREIKSPGNMS